MKKCFIFLLALLLMVPAVASGAEANPSLPLEEWWRDDKPYFYQEITKSESSTIFGLGTPGVHDSGHSPESEAAMLNGRSVIYSKPAYNNADQIIYKGNFYSLIDDCDVVQIYIAVQKAVLTIEVDGSSINYTSTWYDKGFQKSFLEYDLLEATLSEDKDEEGFTLSSAPVLQEYLDRFGVLACMGIVYLTKDGNGNMKYVFEREAMQYYLMTNMLPDEYTIWIAAELENLKQNAQTSDQKNMV